MRGDKEDNRRDFLNEIKGTGLILANRRGYAVAYVPVLKVLHFLCSPAKSVFHVLKD